MSTIPRPFIRHTDYLGVGHPPSAGIRRLERTLTTILPATIRCNVTKSFSDCRVIVYFPLSYRDFTRGNLDSFCQKDWKFSASFCNKAGPPALRTLARMDKYDQATLPEKRESITSSESPILLEALITVWWSLLEAFKHKYGIKMDRKGHS